MRTIQKLTLYLESDSMEALPPEHIECMLSYANLNTFGYRRCFVMEAETLNIDFPKCLGRPRKTQFDKQ